MKKLFLLIAITVAIGCLATSGFAVTNASQNVSVSVGETLALELDPLAPCGAGQIDWTNIEPTSNLVYATAHDPTKSDVGVRCKSNRALGWQLSMRFVATSPELAGKMKFYMKKPLLPDGTTFGNGTLIAGQPPAAGADWPVMPSADTVVYASGTNDVINTPNGSYAGISYALNPAGLAVGPSYTGAITYTISPKP